MAENVKTPNKPKQGTRLRNFIASGGKASEYESCKGLEKAVNTKKK
jgi:hypothetical protein